MQDITGTIDANIDRKWGSNQWVGGGFYAIESGCGDVPERGGGGR